MFLIHLCVNLNVIFNTIFKGLCAPLNYMKVKGRREDYSITVTYFSYPLQDALPDPLGRQKMGEWVVCGAF